MCIRDRAKTSRSLWDFNDLEHFALKALSDPDTAREVSGAYDALFVDEYQDVSHIQEAIITSLVVLQGGSFEQAVLSAILYRILQTFLPYLLSFAFYPRLLRINQNAIKPTDVRI